MQESYKSIALPEAQKIISDNKDNPELVVLDVRTPEEFEMGALGKSINIDIYNSNFLEKIDRLDKEKTYIVCCRTGNRSKQAAEIMGQMGFKKILEIDKGIIG